MSRLQFTQPLATALERGVRVYSTKSIAGSCLRALIDM